MFWKKKKVKKPGIQPTRKDIIANTTQTMQDKREEIGDETLDSIRQAIARRENDPLTKAKREIENADVDKVLDNLSVWLKDKE